MKDGMEVALAIRNTIRSSTFLSRPYGFNDPALNLQGVLTASLGVSAIKSNATPGASVEQQKNELLRAADAALYRAKQNGKDRCIGARGEDSRFAAAQSVAGGG
jgi:PleD family two-component response regulator